MKNEHEKAVPELRFPGYTDAWVKEQFKELLESQNGIRRGPFGSALKKDLFVENGPYQVYEQQNAIYNRFNTRYQISTETFKSLNKFEILAGDFIMSGAGTIGRIAEVPEGVLKGVFNQALIRFRLSQDTDSQFFLQLMRSEIMQKKLLNANPGSAMTNLVPMSEVKKYDVFIPSTEEQTKIGTFFQTLDQLITVNERKVKNLKLMKKSLLQKMFPKDGSEYPELRFPEYTDAWVKHNFGELAKFLNGRAYKQLELLDEGTYKVLRVGNFNTNNKWYYSDLELPSKNYAKKGDLLYTWATAFGPHIWQGERVIYHYHIWKVEISDQLEKQFTYQLLEADKQNITKNTNGSTMIHVTKREMESKNIQIPTVDEQTKIGAFFKNLDQLITVNERKVQHLKKQKKALLQKMFV